MVNDASIAQCDSRTDAPPRLRVLLRLALILSIGSAAWLTESSAKADHGPDSIYPTSSLGACIDGGIGDAFCLSDNSTLTVFREASIGATGRTNIASALNNQFNPTDLTVSYDTSASYSGSAETDIIYQHGTGVPAGLSGIAWCDDAISAIRCDQHYIRFTSANPGTALSAHETGHAVGLAHPNNADPPQAPNDALFQTMVTPVFTSNLGAHNIQQINSIY